MSVENQVVKFSIIIPTYNRAELLKRCLDSLLRQSYQNFEVLVCDDGSTDITADVVKSYSDKMDLYYYYDTNWGGPARPRNLGLCKARAEWVAFLDADDYWEDHKLEEIVKVLNESDVIYHKMIMVNEKGQTLGKITSAFLNKPIFQTMLVNGNKIPLSSVVCRKKVISLAGGFSEDKKFIALEDYDLWLRLSLQNTRFTFISKFLGFYHVGGNISQASLVQLRRTRAIYLKYLPLVKNKRDRRDVIGSYAYQKFRMLMLVEGRGQCAGAFKLALKYAIFIQKLKAFVIYFKIKT